MGTLPGNLLRTGLVCLIGTSNLFAVIPEIPMAAIWEFRADATAGNLNAGFYNNDPALQTDGPVDFSTQTIAQVTISDLSIDAVDPKIVFSAVLSSITYQHKNNGIHITAGAGFLPRLFTINSVDGSGRATLSAPAGSVGSTLGTARIGGAFSLNTNAGARGDDDILEQLSPGNTVYMRGDTGALNCGEAVSISTDATAQNPVNFIGYKTVRGDNPQGSDRPIIAANANGFAVGGDRFNYVGLIVTGTAITNWSDGTGSIATNVKSVNDSVTSGRIAFAMSGASRLFDSEISCPNGIGLTANSNVLAKGNTIHTSSTCLSLNVTVSATIEDNIFSNCDSTGVTIATAQNTITTNVKFLHNILVGSETAKANSTAFFNNSNVASDGTFRDNIVTGFGVIGNFTHMTGSNQFDYNVYFNNLAVDFTTNTILGPHDRFVNPGWPAGYIVTRNFTPGASVIGKSIPGAFPASQTTGSVNVGAVQSSGTVLGGGGQRTYTFGN